MGGKGIEVTWYIGVKVLEKHLIGYSGVAQMNDGRRSGGSLL